MPFARFPYASPPGQTCRRALARRVGGRLLPGTLQGHELVFARTADRALPVLGEVLELRSRFGTGCRLSRILVIDIPADRAHPLCHSSHPGAMRCIRSAIYYTLSPAPPKPSRNQAKHRRIRKRRKMLPRIAWRPAAFPGMLFLPQTSSRCSALTQPAGRRPDAACPDVPPEYLCSLRGGFLLFAIARRPVMSEIPGKK